MLRTAPVILLLLSAMVLAGCASQPSESDSSPLARTTTAILWKRTTAEYSANSLQTYRLAKQRLVALHAQGLLPDRWSVVLDVDETILDNSHYDMERANLGLPWSRDSWTQWVEKRQATAIPGAASFLDRVRQLGGRIALVTNRDEATRAATVDNLQSLGLPFDYLGPMQNGVTNKTDRWRHLADKEGLNVIMWIGDQISDMPLLPQCEARDMSTPEPVDTRPLSGRFGEAMEYPLSAQQVSAIDRCAGLYYFVLSNPIYGGWRKNEWR